MATDMDQAYREWSHDKLSDRNDSEEASVPQFVDHGSISFGKFAAESLSWEKWSVFSNNKCQEELDKFKAPGLVAQKKAYFEEYYKRIRALKALEQHQQAVPGSDTGGNNSVCSQSGEEQNTSQVENTVEVTAQIARSDENIVEATVVHETKSIDGPQLQYSETEAMVSYPNSLRRTSNEWIEEIRQVENVCNNLSDEIITGNHDYSNEIVEEIKQQENNCNSLSDEEIIRKVGCSITAVKPEAAIQGTAPKQAAILQRGSGVTPTIDFVPKKVELNNKKCKGHSSFHKAKEAATSDRKDGKSKYDSIRKETVADSVRNNAKMDHRAKANASISSQGLKYALHKATGKAEKVINSSNPISRRASGNKNSASASSNREPAEIGSNVHRPIPLSMVRRAAVRASTRDTSLGHYSNERLSIHPKDKSSIQNMSIGVTIPRSMKNTTFEDRRSHEIVTKSMVLDSRHTTCNRRDAEVSRLKAISSKLPVQSKSNQSGGGLEYSLQSNGRREKQNEVKEKEEPKNAGQSSKSVALQPTSFSKTRILKQNHDKKIVSSRSVDLTRSTGKSRQRMPVWR